MIASSDRFLCAGASSALSGSRPRAPPWSGTTSAFSPTPTINTRTKLLWITVGGPQDIAYNNNFAMLRLFTRYHVKYKFLQGTGGNVWNTWRHDPLRFAPLLFR